MHQNMPFQGTNFKSAPYPDLSSSGEGKPPLHNPPCRRLRRLDPRAFSSWPPPLKSPRSATGRV